VQAPLAYLNGRLLPQAEAALAIHDAGVMFGATVTDYCRTIGRRLYLWPWHLARLRDNCERCFIPLVPSDDELTQQAEELVEHNARLLPAGEELALITFATPGPLGALVGAPGQDGPPTLVMHTLPLDRGRYRRFFTEGAALAVPGRYDPDPHGLAPPYVKHRSRLHWWSAERMLAERMLAEPGRVPAEALAMPLTSRGCITETAIATVLVVIDGAVFAPRLGTALQGISLRVVAGLCGELGIEFIDGELLLEELQGAKEAMVCGSAFCLAGVSWAEGVQLPWPGPLTRRLLAAWSERVGVDIAEWFTRP
jgi:branched-chain amino acid aminotransferase